MEVPSRILKSNIEAVLKVYMKTPSSENFHNFQNFHKVSPLKEAEPDIDVLCVKVSPYTRF